MAISLSTSASISLSTALNSLGSSATAAAQSSVVTLGSGNIVDIVANWTIAIGTITPSNTTRVDVYVWGSQESSGYPGGSATNEVITGTAGSITLSSYGNAALRYLKSTPAHTSGISISSQASIVAVLGFIPARWGLVFINQTGTALASSGHSATYVETSYT